MTLSTNMRMHLKSAAITFLAAFILELNAAFQSASGWEEITWRVLLSSASFVAVRAVLKMAVSR